MSLITRITRLQPKLMELLGPRFLISVFLFLGAGLLAETYLTLHSFSHLPPTIPLWYTNPWGRTQLASSALLFALPILTALILIINYAVVKSVIKHRERLVAQLLVGFTVVVVVTLLYSLHRLIIITTPGTEPPLLLQTRIVAPFVVALASSALLSFPTIALAKRFGLVDDPRTHHHPGMLLTRAIPRAGAVPLVVTIVGLGLLLLPATKHLLGVYLGMLIMTTIGVLDDKKDINPYLRILGQLLAVACVVGVGIGISYINDPFNGELRLDTVIIPINALGEHSIILFADLLALAWIVWTMNMVSWSNGVDGQFPGTMSIAFAVVGLISLRVANQQPDQWLVAILAFIAAGACLGTIPFAWHPSKFLYGFGTTALGLLLATLSILSGAKVATAVLVLMVPTIDTLFAIIRRLRRGQSPVWGDREHFHHKLLDLGWGQRRTALFYWAATASFGALALQSSGKEKVLIALTGSGLVAFTLFLLSEKIKVTQKRAL